MLEKKDLERIKELINSDDDVNIKIGIGLALNKGLTIRDLVKEVIDLTNINELLPDYISDDSIQFIKDTAIDAYVEMLTEIHEKEI